MGEGGQSVVQSRVSLLHIAVCSTYLHHIVWVDVVLLVAASSETLIDMVEHNTCTRRSAYIGGGPETNARFAAAWRPFDANRRCCRWKLFVAPVVVELGVAGEIRCPRGLEVRVMFRVGSCMASDQETRKHGFCVTAGRSGKV